jgi:hypothetical protein
VDVERPGCAADGGGDVEVLKHASLSAICSRCRHGDQAMSLGTGRIS